MSKQQLTRAWGERTKKLHTASTYKFDAPQQKWDNRFDSPSATSMSKGNALERYV
jgi:hypothetical protein